MDTSPDQRATNAVRSSTVNWYMTVSASTRVKRSIRCRFRSDPRNGDLSVKLVESTTSVFPSQCPRGSPSQNRMFGLACGRPSSGNHADVMDHLAQDCHIAGRLDDLI